MVEQCMAFQYKQGVGLLNTIPVTILNAGHYKVAQKAVGKKSIFNRSKVFTGFNPAYAQYLTQEARYLGIFDYDTDVQLDIHEIFKKVGKVTPDEMLIQRKIMSGAMLNAQRRTREERSRKPWWQSNLVGFVFLCITFIIMVYLFEHGTPINANINVQLTNGTYRRTVNNGTLASGGIAAATIGAVSGTYNATVNGLGSLGKATAHPATPA